MEAKKKGEFADSIFLLNNFNMRMAQEKTDTAIVYGNAIITQSCYFEDEGMEGFFPTVLEVQLRQSFHCVHV